MLLIEIHSVYSLNIHVYLNRIAWSVDSLICLRNNFVAVFSLNFNLCIYSVLFSTPFVELVFFQERLKSALLMTTSFQ